MHIAHSQLELNGAVYLECKSNVWIVAREQCNYGHGASSRSWYTSAALALRVSMRSFLNSKAARAFAGLLDATPIGRYLFVLCYPCFRYLRTLLSSLIASLFFIYREK